MKQIRILILALLLISICSCSTKSEVSVIQNTGSEASLSSKSEAGLPRDVYTNSKYSKSLTIRFLGLNELGVKNGDASLIITPEGHSILVDSGNADNTSKLISMISKTGTKKLDYVIFTHFHGDHVGNFSKLAESFEIGKVILLDFPEYRGKERQSILDVLQKKSITYEHPKAGAALSIDNQITLNILSPAGTISYPDNIDQDTRAPFENQNSLVFKLTYIDNSFLFTGDIYTDTESTLVKQYGSLLKSDLLKVPHHGLSTSSSTKFLMEVEPKISIVMSGEPTNNILNSLRNRSDTYTTGAYGTVLVVSDGKNLEVITEHEDRTNGVYGK